MSPKEMIGMRQLDLLGSCVATAIFSLVILVFLARLAGRSAWEFWLGVALLLMAVPLMATLAFVQRAKLGR